MSCRGVALNCVSNGRMKRDSKFKNIFIQPATNDAGGAVGAAALAYRDITGVRVCSMTGVYLGPEYSDREIFTLLSQMDIEFEDYQENEEGFLNR